MKRMAMLMLLTKWSKDLRYKASERGKRNTVMTKKTRATALVLLNETLKALKTQLVALLMTMINVKEKMKKRMILGAVSMMQMPSVRVL